MIPRIQDFKQVGRIGELEVGSLLSDFANIGRPEFDVGMDFYCELLDENQLSGKMFWVQVKTVNKFSQIWKKRIDKKTITHWLNQFYPVFIILFEKSSGGFYWISTQEKRKKWEGKLIDKNKTIEVVIDRSQSLKKNCANTAFKKAVMHDLILSNASHGVPHMIGTGYVRSIPVLDLSDKARGKIFQKIRLGLNYLMKDSWIKSKNEEAYTLAKILTEFDKSHYDHFAFLAQICHTIGKNEESITYYDLAIEICNRDKNWNSLKRPDDPTIEDVIRMLQREKQKVRLN